MVFFVNTGDTTWLDTADTQWNLLDASEISVGSSTLTYTGQTLTLQTIIPIDKSDITYSGQSLSLLATIPIEASFITFAGQGISLSTTLPIGSSFLTYVGQSLTLPIFINSRIVTYSGQGLSIPINIGTAQLNYSGKTVQLILASILTIEVGSSLVSYIGKPVSIIQYETDPSFKPAELIPFPEVGEPHLPCGHWHEGQNDNPVWDFVPQETLPYPYHKHPTRPEICGHWHRQPSTTVTTKCLEYISEVTVSDTAIPSGLSKSNKGLLYHTDGYLYGASGNSGYIFRMDPSTLQILESTTFTISEIKTFKQLSYYNGYLWALITIDGYIGNWIQKITMPAIGSSNNFTLAAEPLYAGDVVVGSDGNNYGCKGATYSNNVAYAPVTGAFWTQVWELLPSDYSYNKTSSYAAFGGRYTVGATLIDFSFVDGDLVFNGGPYSTILSYWPMLNKFSLTGTFIANRPVNNSLGPNEMVQNPLGSNAAFLRCTGAITNLTVAVFYEDLSYDTPVLVSGLLDESGNPYDASIYHLKTVWHSNGLVYNLHACYSTALNRIIAISPHTGQVIHQFIFGTGTTSGASFIILNNYVYVWQQVLVEEHHTSSIAKLTLELELVCIEQCWGNLAAPIYGEVSGQLATDNVQYLFNYTEDSVIKYRVDIPLDNDDVGPWELEPIDWSFEPEDWF